MLIDMVFSYLACMGLVLLRTSHKTIPAVANAITAAKTSPSHAFEDEPLRDTPVCTTRPRNQLNSPLNMAARVMPNGIHQIASDSNFARPRK
jgi:hypothetical protein